MEKTTNAFGIFEIFSYIAPGFIILLSIYLSYWPNPSQELFKEHINFFSQISFVALLFIISYIIGFIFYFISTSLFQRIQALLGKSPEKYFQKQYFYPDEEIQIDNNNNNENTYGVKLKHFLENNYGHKLSFWSCYKQCESAVRAKYPQNAEISNRFNALAIMSRNMSLSFFILTIVLIFNVSFGKVTISFGYIILIILILASTIILIQRAFRFSYWAIREIFNTYYFMNFIDKKIVENK